MQVLYQVDVGRMGTEDAFSNLRNKFTISDADIEFARQLVTGTMEKLPELDAIITRLCRDWSLERIARVDRSILRMGLFEIYYDAEIPFNVTINEAVELAKKFGGKESGKFINGVLGKAAEEIR